MNGFTIGLNARVHRKVLNVSNFLLNATKTSQRRPHFHRAEQTKKEKKKATTADFAFARALPCPKEKRILELRAEGFGEDQLRDRQKGRVNPNF